MSADFTSVPVTWKLWTILPSFLIASEPPLGTLIVAGEIENSVSVTATGPLVAPPSPEELPPESLVTATTAATNRAKIEVASARRVNRV